MPAVVKERKTVTVTVKVPPDLHALLRQWAQEEDRSLHGQVLFLLKQAAKQRQDADR
jgi:hypothetical protein